MRWLMQIRLMSVIVASTVALLVFGAIGAWLGGAHKVLATCCLSALHWLQADRTPGLSLVQNRLSFYSCARMSGPGRLIGSDTSTALDWCKIGHRMAVVLLACMQQTRSNSLTDALCALQLRASSRVLVGGWVAMAVTYGVGRLFGEGGA